jgi:hypothetical protein
MDNCFCTHSCGHPRRRDEGFSSAQRPVNQSTNQIPASAFRSMGPRPPPSGHAVWRQWSTSCPAVTWPNRWRARSAKWDVSNETVLAENPSFVMPDIWCNIGIFFVSLGQSFCCYHAQVFEQKVYSEAQGLRFTFYRHYLTEAHVIISRPQLYSCSGILVQNLWM